MRYVPGGRLDRSPGRLLSPTCTYIRTYMCTCYMRGMPDGDWRKLKVRRTGIIAEEEVAVAGYVCLCVLGRERQKRSE